MPFRFLLAALALAALPAAAFAQEDVPGWYGDDYRTCTNQTTVEIVECVLDLARDWDDRLNAAYEEAVAALPPDRAEALREVQRAWIAWRDANCRWYYAGPGSISRIEAAECHRVLTGARALEIEVMNGR